MSAAARAAQRVADAIREASVIAHVPGNSIAGLGVEMRALDWERFAIELDRETEQTE